MNWTLAHLRPTPPPEPAPELPAPPRQPSAAELREAYLVLVRNAAKGVEPDHAELAKLPAANFAGDVAIAKQARDYVQLLATIGTEIEAAEQAHEKLLTARTPVDAAALDRAFREASRLRIVRARAENFVKENALYLETPNA